MSPPNPQRLLLFATLQEAQKTLETLHGQQETGSLYSFQGGKIVISGMGSLAAATTVANHGASFEEIWNVGIAGVLHDHLPLGAFFEVGQCRKHLSLPPSIDPHSQELSEKQHPSLSLNGSSYRLISSDYPIHQQATRERISEKGELVDMEGYGVAFAAKKMGKKCVIWKLSSDPALPGGAAMIADQLPLWSELLAKKCEELLGLGVEASLPSLA